MVFVNHKQSREERKAKYRLAKMYGYTTNQAIRMRDWGKNILLQYLFERHVRKTSQ